MLQYAPQVLHLWEIPDLHNKSVFALAQNPYRALRVVAQLGRKRIPDVIVGRQLFEPA
jgi:hypothetical protein